MAFPIRTELTIGEEIVADERVFDVHEPQPCLSCPVCAEVYTHVASAHTSFGVDEDEAGHPIAGTRAHGVRPGWRRDALVVNVWCEQGHSFAVIFQQHKGVTYLFTRRGPDQADFGDEHDHR